MVTFLVAGQAIEVLERRKLERILCFVATQVLDCRRKRDGRELNKTPHKQQDTEQDLVTVSFDCSGPGARRC